VAILRDALLLGKNVVVAANFARLSLRRRTAPTTIDVWPMMGPTDTIATMTTCGFV
jgi:hypothetical protein